MEASEAAIQELKSDEGFRSKAYLDSGGVWTVGYGTTHIAGRAVVQGDLIEEPQAEYEMRQDIRLRAASISAALKVVLTQNQFDAVLRLAYNIGLPAFLGSRLLRLLNLKDFVGASNEFPKWDMDNGKVVPGLLARRLREQSMFTTL